MKPLTEQDHYETLEVPRSASAQDIERAYRMARATYTTDSLAGHSVFEPGDIEALQERIETAFRTLGNADRRRAYDAELAEREGEKAEQREESEPMPLQTRALPEEALVELDELDPLEAESGEFDGARLRRTRIRNGVELEDIAGITKINPTYLRFLEDERFDDLPAAVYVRGFVMGYAGCVGLDPQQVASSYMKRYEASQQQERRGLFRR